MKHALPTTGKHPIVTIHTKAPLDAYIHTCYYVYMRRTKEEAEQTKEDLLDAALVIFGRDGFTASRLSDIAKEAQVTRGAIYHHFENKADMYLQLIKRAEQEQQEVMNAAIAKGGTIAEITRRIMVTGFESLAKHTRYRNVMELSLFKIADNEELKELIEKRREEAHSLVKSISAIMAQGIEAGEFRSDLDPSTAARAYLSYQNGVAFLWLSNKEAFSLKNQAHALADIYMRGILT